MGLKRLSGKSVENSLRREFAEGLIYTHARLSENTKTTLEAASFLYGLIELLNEKGLLTIEELDERKCEVADRLTRKNRKNRVGVLLQEPEYDKYTFTEKAEIDCERRVYLCKAACCRLPFALSKQDIREGILHWDLGQPYIISQNIMGYCIHLDNKSFRCTVWEHRAVPCQAYDCRKDDTIWSDFQKKIINPDIWRNDWPRCVPPQTQRSECA